MSWWGKSWGKCSRGSLGLAIRFLDVFPSKIDENKLRLKKKS